LYNNANGIIALKEHVYANHCMIVKLFEEEVNILVKEPNKRELAKKRPQVNGSIIFNFFATKNSYKRRSFAVEVVFGRFNYFNC
jgi:hypothetical protein